MGDTSSILNWLRQMAGANAPVRPFAPAPGIGAGMYGAPATPVAPSPQMMSPDPRFAGITPQSVPPGGYLFGPEAANQAPVPGPGAFAGMRDVPYRPWDVSRGFEQATGGSPPPGRTPPGAVPPGTMPPGTGPMAQTKTEPRAPLQFAWGGNAPQNYAPGVTEVLEMQGAPPGGREGFMGAEPPDPMQPGGYGPSQQDWGNVANPGGFESFQSAPGIEETIRSAQDPLWREKGTVEAATEGQKELFTHQAGLAEQMQTRQEARLVEAITTAVEEARAAAEREGREFTEQEEDLIRGQVYQRFMALSGGAQTPFGR